jgi:hypothetical protein
MLPSVLINWCGVFLLVIAVLTFLHAIDIWDDYSGRTDRNAGIILTVLGIAFLIAGHVM